MTPAAENVRGTSALPFHLLVHRPEGVDVDVYSLDYNLLPSEKIAESESRLNVKINILPRSKWIDWVISHKLGLVCRLFMRYPIHNYVKLTDAQVTDIKSKAYDGIWIYGAEMSRVSRQFAEYNRLHLLPDCTSLFFDRMMKLRFVRKSPAYMMKNFVFYRKYRRMESEYDIWSNIHYFLVGEADRDSLAAHVPGIQAHFLRHPHYDVKTPDSNRDYSIGCRKIRLLIAGRNDYYMQQDAELAVTALCEHSELVRDYSVTFLGKGWESQADRLSSSGYDTHHISFADNYIDEVSKHDVQLAPISIGTGTKGKVLDALSNGVLVIGTLYAMENISVDNGESCIVYESVSELIEWLKRLTAERSLISKMADNGRDRVLTEHSREKLAKSFFGFLNPQKKY